MYVPQLVWRWLQVVGVGLVTVAVLWLVAQMLFHVRFLNVQTGSMRPTFRPHDALVMQRAGEDGIRVGQIVAYKSPRNPNELVTHRVVRLLPVAHSFEAQGDALRQPDPIVRNTLVAGRVVAVLPGLGRVLGWLQSWPGLVVCVYVPAIAIATTELYKLERSYKARHFYSLIQT